MKLLVTGGLGFVGSNLLPHLLKDSIFRNITVIDNLRHTANPEILPELSKNRKFRFVEGDIRDECLMNRLVSEHGHIINLAAETFVDSSISDSRPFFETNIMGLQVILEATRKHSIQKLVHVSTDEVWGEAKGSVKFNENSPYAPRNPYSASKAGADHLVRAYGETYKTPYNIVHFSNLYGPWQYPEKLIPKFIINLIEGKKLTIYGDGKNVRVWLHVNDAIEGLTHILRTGCNKESYALGSEAEYSNLEVTNILLELFNKTEKEIVFVGDRLGHDFRYAVDYTKAESELGWQPTIEFREGLTRKVEWYKEHSDWWGRRR